MESQGILRKQIRGRTLPLFVCVCVYVCDPVITPVCACMWNNNNNNWKLNNNIFKGGEEDKEKVDEMEITVWRFEASVYVCMCVLFLSFKLQYSRFVLSQKSRIRWRGTEIQRKGVIEDLVCVESSSQGHGIQSKVVSVFSIDEHKKADPSRICQLRREECRPQQAAHTLQSHFNLYRRLAVQCC